MPGIVLITPDGIRHEVNVALVGPGISISRDAYGRLVIDSVVATAPSYTYLNLTGIDGATSTVVNVNDETGAPILAYTPV